MEKHNQASHADELNPEYLEMENNGFVLNAYKISFMVNDLGILDIHMDWPEEINEEATDRIALLLHAINKGEAKSLVTQALLASAIQEDDLEPVVKQVIDKWLEISNTGSEPCIKPGNTLKQ